MLAKALGENGHDVDLMVYHLGEDVEIPGCQILRIPKLWFIPKVSIGFSGSEVGVRSFLFSFLRRVLSHRYDVIHAGEESIFFALLIRFVHRARVVYDMRFIHAATNSSRSGPGLNRSLACFTRLSGGRFAARMRLCRSVGARRASHGDQGREFGDPAGRLCAVAAGWRRSARR